jgi:hypothetical protein
MDFEKLNYLNEQLIKKLILQNINAKKNKLWLITNEERINLMLIKINEILLKILHQNLNYSNENKEITNADFLCLLLDIFLNFFIFQSEFLGKFNFDSYLIAYPRVLVNKFSFCSYSGTKKNRFDRFF